MEMSQFDRPHTISYWRSMIATALSYIVSKIGILVENRDVSYNFYNSPLAFSPGGCSRSCRKCWQSFSIANIFALFLSQPRQMAYQAL